MATVHYLKWGLPGHEENQDLMTRLSTLTAAQSEQHSDQLVIPKDKYLKIATESVNKSGTKGAEEIFQKWNAGSGRESDTFREVRICEECGEVFESPDAAAEHLRGDVEPEELEDSGVFRVRSLSAGDVVTVDGSHYVTASIGFIEAEFGDELAGLES